MALTDFFRINIPYGIEKNENGEWMAFNREYVPLGCSDSGKKYGLGRENISETMSLYTAYDRLTDATIVKIFGETLVHRDSTGAIKSVHFYKDGTNPQTFPENWDTYFEKIKAISKFARK